MLKKNQQCKWSDFAGRQLISSTQMFICLERRSIMTFWWIIIFWLHSGHSGSTNNVRIIFVSWLLFTFLEVFTASRTAAKSEQSVQSHRGQRQDRGVVQGLLPTFHPTRFESWPWSLLVVMSLRILCDPLELIESFFIKILFIHF